MNWKKVVVTGVFGSLGAIFRYLVYWLITLIVYSPTFYSTLVVNLVGSFFLSYFAIRQINDSKQITFLSQYTAEILGGFIGSFTTFSTLILEISFFDHIGSYFTSLIYLLLTLVLSFVAALFGEKLALTRINSSEFTQDVNFEQARSGGID